MVHHHRNEDVECGNLPPCGSDSPVIFDFERSNPSAPEERPKSARGWIAVIIVGCIILLILGLLVWGVVAYATPSSPEQPTPPKNILSRNIPYSTTNVSIMGSIANGSSHNSTSSLIDSVDAHCETKYDCDWNQLCSDGTCESGCESNEDCVRPQHCKNGWCRYKSTFCRKIPCAEKCFVNLEVCEKNKECCSKICRRSSKDKTVKVCYAGSRQKKKDVDEEGEVEDME